MHKQDFLEQLLISPDDEWIASHFNDLINHLVDLYGANVCAQKPDFAPFWKSIHALRRRTYMHLGFFVGLVHHPGFAAYVIQHGRPEARAFIPYVKHELEKVIRGTEPDRSAPTRLEHVEYPTLDHFVWKLRAVYLSRYNAFGTASVTRM